MHITHFLDFQCCCFVFKKGLSASLFVVNPHPPLCNIRKHQVHLPNWKLRALITEHYFFKLSSYFFISVINKMECSCLESIRISILERKSFVFSTHIIYALSNVLGSLQSNGKCVTISILSTTGRLWGRLGGEDLAVRGEGAQLQVVHDDGERAAALYCAPLVAHHIRRRAPSALLTASGDKRKLSLLYPRTQHCFKGHDGPLQDITVYRESLEGLQWPVIGNNGGIGGSALYYAKESWHSSSHNGTLLSSLPSDFAREY